MHLYICIFDRVFMAMTLAGQVIGQASSFLPDYSKGRLAAGYIFQMMGIKPNIDNFSTAGVKKVGILWKMNMLLNKKIFS